MCQSHLVQVLLQQGMASPLAAGLEDVLHQLLPWPCLLHLLLCGALIQT
jgi:hypothetical protein